MSSLQIAQKLAHAVEVLDDVASRLRRRAAQQAAAGAITFADYQKIDEVCDRVNATAHKLDAKVLSLALDGLDEPLGRIEAATANLDAARERLEKLKSAIEVSTKLLLAILAVAAMVVDPTRITSLAAATAIASLATTIADAAPDT